MLPQLRELLRVLQHRREARGQRVARRVVAGREHDQVVAERLDRPHRLAVRHLRGGEQRREVVARPRAAILR